MNRISIKMGDLEIQYEGDQVFIEEQLVGFVRELSELEFAAPKAPVQAGHANGPESAPSDISTNTIAQIIGARTGSDLVISALARITIIKNRPTATRQELLSEMKEATTFYKETFASNLSSYLDSLVKSKRINLVSRQTYALPAGERGRLQEMLTAGV